jgi:hypothetical protein
MAESKFTSGPWVAEQHRDCGIFRIKAGEENISSLSFWNEANEDANAELMADAPALLNALRALCECTVPDPEEDRDLTRRVFADAERLLEKHGG